MTTRNANPSTTAVLPTPASPVRMGLFCRRRVRMSMTWRISASRPSTGSILPLLALPVRSTVYWSRLGVLPPPGFGPPSPGPAGGSCRSRRLTRKRNDAHQIFAQSVRIDLLELRLTSLMRRESSSSETSARIAKPVRTCPALKSIEPIVQAVVSIFSTVGLMAGVRALPDFSLSMLRLSSASVCDLSTSKCLRMAAKSPDAESSSLVRKCSISMS